MNLLDSLRCVPVDVRSWYMWILLWVRCTSMADSHLIHGWLSKTKLLCVLFRQNGDLLTANICSFLVNIILWQSFRGIQTLLGMLLLMINLAMHDMPFLTLFNRWLLSALCLGYFSFKLRCRWSMLIVSWLTHRLFQYIQGANLNFSRIAMTAPVLTSIVPGAGPLHSSAYFVRFYLPTKFQTTPPTPLPQLSLEPYTWDSHYIAVRKFSGFARDTNIMQEAEKLATSLSRSPWANSTSEESSCAYSIAQYSSPFRVIGRVNEVWVEVNPSGLGGYKYSEIATSWNSSITQCDFVNFCNNIQGSDLWTGQEMVHLNLLRCICMYVYVFDNLHVMCLCIPFFWKYEPMKNSTT